MKRFALASLLGLAATMANSAEPEASMLEYVDGTVRAWFADPAVQAAIRHSNDVHASLDEAQILALDTRWSDEIGHTPAPTITPVADSMVSISLRQRVEDSAGVISEIILMDDRGLNVAVSAVTSDFWQGDEAKFLETFPKGADAVHIGEVELDESSQTYQVQVSFTVSDVETGAPIGAVTLGLNAEAF